MASIKKFTHAAMSKQNEHIFRESDNPSNNDIDHSRTHLNKSFPMNHNGLKPFEYYKKLISEKYLYGRGTQREKDAITGCGWVVTLPKELLGDQKKEEAFFKATYDFICNRYGLENIISNAIHYDEKGLPHLHVLICPSTKLDHNIVQYKTKKTKQAIKLESGRYEYKYIHVDKNGRPLDESKPETWIKLNNYARMSDYYDEKIDSNSVFNKIELSHFHSDLQNYLIQNSVEGKIITGKTGTNFTVKELKEFTAKTGMHLDEVKEMMQDNKSLLQSFVEKDAKVQHLEQILQEKDIVIESLKEEIRSKEKSIDRTKTSDEITQKNDQIKALTLSVSDKEQELSKVSNRNAELEKKLAEMEKSIEEKQGELERANARIKELEKEKSVEFIQPKTEQTWGQSSTSWADKSQSGWGTSTKTYEEEHTW